MYIMYVELLKVKKVDAVLGRELNYISYAWYLPLIFKQRMSSHNSNTLRVDPHLVA